MKKSLKAVAFTACQCFLFSSVAFASLPVNYSSEGCVIKGKVFSLYQGKLQHEMELPPGFNVTAYEGKKVMLEGSLTPPNYLVPKYKELRTGGSCFAHEGELQSGAPAKPAAAAPEKPAAPGAAKPAPAPVATKPAPAPVATTPAPAPAPVAKPAPAPAKPAPVPVAKPAAPAGQTRAACRQECQGRYDRYIRQCAGYSLGNTAPACRDTATRDLQACQQSCP